MKLINKIESGLNYLIVHFKRKLHTRYVLSDGYYL